MGLVRLLELFDPLDAEFRESREPLIMIGAPPELSFLTFGSSDRFMFSVEFFRLDGPCSSNRW